MYRDITHHPTPPHNHIPAVTLKPSRPVRGFERHRHKIPVMKKFALLAIAALLLGASACKVETCPAYSKSAPAKPAPVARRA